MNVPRVIIASRLLVAGIPSTLHPRESVDVDQTSGRREFRFAFPKNFRDSVTDNKTDGRRAADPLSPTLTIVAETGTRVEIAVEGLGVKTDLIVDPGQAVAAPVDSRAQTVSSEIVGRPGARVTADHPISRYACDRRYQTSDTWVVWPVEALGASYRVVGGGGWGTISCPG